MGLFLIWVESRKSPYRPLSITGNSTTTSSYSPLHPTDPNESFNKQTDFESQTMQTWRRAFTTSITRLNHSPSTSALGTRPILLRCAKLLQESGRNEDQEIRLQGLVRNVRKQKKMAFVEVSDGSTIQPVHALMKPDFAVE